MKKSTKDIIMGAIIFTIPLGFVLVGGYLLYRGIKESKNKEKGKGNDTDRNV